MAVSTDKLTDTTGIQLKDAFVVIVKTEWNAHVVDVLEEGCIKILKGNGVNYKTVIVPGAFEIPFAVNKYWQSLMDAEPDFFETKKTQAAIKEIKYPDAFIALGCVIKGDTPHFDYVCAGVTQGIAQLNITLPVPVIYGLLTVNSQIQADERMGGRHGHKGEEAAAAAIKMIALSESFDANN